MLDVRLKGIVKVAILTIVLRDQLSPGLAALAITYIMMIGDSTRSSPVIPIIIIIVVVIKPSSSY